MKSITTLEPPAPTNTKNILSKNGYACGLVTLEPGQELTIEHAASGEERLVFVVSGAVTIRAGEIATMLSKNEAHLLASDCDSTIVAAEEHAAILLRVDVPPRRVVDAPLYTIGASQADEIPRRNRNA